MTTTHQEAEMKTADYKFAGRVTLYIHRAPSSHMPFEVLHFVFHPTMQFMRYKFESVLPMIEQGLHVPFEGYDLAPHERIMLEGEFWIWNHFEGGRLVAAATRINRTQFVIQDMRPWYIKALSVIAETVKDIFNSLTRGETMNTSVCIKGKK